MSRTIQPLKYGDETIYIEVSEVEELGQADRKQGTDRFEEVNALDKVKEAGNQVHDTIKALSKRQVMSGSGLRIVGMIVIKVHLKRVKRG